MRKSSFTVLSSPNELSMGVMENQMFSGEGVGSGSKNHAVLERMKKQYTAKIQEQLFNKTTSIVDLFGHLPNPSSFVYIG
eukprot:2208822-Rhodomonas_salina.1